MLGSSQMVDEEEKDEFCFRWEIKNFSYLALQTSEALNSPTALVDVLDETKWYILIYPRGKEDEEFIDIFLNRADDDFGGDTIPIIFTIELEAADSSAQERRVSPRCVFKRQTSNGFQKFIKRSTLMEDMKSYFLPDDTLTVLCKLERAPDDCDDVEEYIAESFIESVALNVNWNIRNWSKIRDFGNVYKDIKFPDGSSFRIFICNKRNRFALKLKKLDCKKDGSVSCSVSVLGPQPFVRLHNYQFHAGISEASHHLFYGGQIQKNITKKDTLRLQFDLNMTTANQKGEVTKVVPASPDDQDEDIDPEKEFKEDFENMYLKGEFCDLKVTAAGRVVNCHQSIIYARSPVLADMLDKADKTSKESVVIDLHDLDGDTLQQMVYFMYTDKIKNIKQVSALKLFAAGNRYQISYLIDKCASYLSTAFNFENVLDILVAAHLHDDSDLERSAISYISRYFSRICLTDQWIAFRKTEKELSEITCREIRRLKFF